MRHDPEAAHKPPHDGPRRQDPHRQQREGHLIHDPHGWVHRLDDRHTGQQVSDHHPAKTGCPAPRPRSELGVHGNLEGLAVWQDPAGQIRLTMVSDDNYLPFMRGQIVEYVLEHRVALPPD